MLIIVLAAAGTIVGALYLGVFSSHPQLALDTFNGVYGTAGTRLDTCSSCHTIGSNTNPYGTHLKSEFSKVKYFLRDESLIKDQKLDTFRAVLRDIDELDSDNDGYSNIAEIKARTFPGDSEDHPVTEQ
jgi:hypothetical protein